MKATGIVEGDPLLTTLTPIDRFCQAIMSFYIGCKGEGG